METIIRLPTTERKSQEGEKAKNTDSKKIFILNEIKRINKKLKKSRKKIEKLQRVNARLETVLHGLNQQRVKLAIDELREADSQQIKDIRKLKIPKLKKLAR
ncbi:MAG: hypothetical protein AAF489_17240 [Bacteroidota bacterium]